MGTPSEENRKVGRMRGIGCVAIIALLAAAPVAHAGPTGITGNGQSHPNMQPSLALNYTIALQGIFPPRDGGAVSSAGEAYLGEVNIFAGNFAPRG